jgi:hypothetical protein
MLVEVANELFAAGQYDGALSSYDEALKVAPDAPELHCNRGAALRSAALLRPLSVCSPETHPAAHGHPPPS